MQVGGKQLRFCLKKLLIVRDRLLVGGEHAPVRQIADVLAQERLIPARQAERTLQLCTACEHGRLWGKGERKRCRRKAAAAAHNLPSACRHAQNRIIHTMHNLPIMHEDRIGNLGESPLCGHIVIDNRLAAEVCTRHDPEIIRGEQEEVYGRVWKHHAETRVPRGNARGDRILPIRPPLQQHNRRSRRGKPAFLLLRDSAQSAHRLKRARHHGERLRLAPFAAAQACDRLIAARVAREMVAADALDRNDSTRRDNFPRLFQRVAVRRRALRQQPIGRPAGSACIRLRVETAVCGIVIFVLAGRAHAKGRHRGQRAVIGHTANDRVPRTAVRTICKGIALPPIRFGQNLAPAVRTDGEIGRDKRSCRLPRRARQDTERHLAESSRLRIRHRRDRSRKRRLRAQRLSKGIKRLRRALRLDPDAGTVVQHPSAEAETHGETVDKGAEPHPLHNPRDAKGAPLAGARLYIRRKRIACHDQMPCALCGRRTAGISPQRVSSSTARCANPGSAAAISVLSVRPAVSSYGCIPSTTTFGIGRSVTVSHASTS